MKTLIEGGWVVAFNGTSHEVYENGSVVYENDRIVHAGGPYTGTVDTRLSARGKLVSPGFINTHVHTTGNGGDYMLHDMVKNNYRTANYLSFAAPLKGKMGAPPSEVVAAFVALLPRGRNTVNSPAFSGISQEPWLSGDRRWKVMLVNLPRVANQDNFSSFRHPSGTRW